MIITAIIVIATIIIFEGNSREVGKNPSVLRTRVRHISSSRISASKLQKWFSMDFFQNRSFLSLNKSQTKYLRVHINQCIIEHTLQRFPTCETLFKPAKPVKSICNRFQIVSLSGSMSATCSVYYTFIESVRPKSAIWFGHQTKPKGSVLSLFRFIQIELHKVQEKSIVYLFELDSEASFTCTFYTFMFYHLERYTLCYQFYSLLT